MIKTKFIIGLVLITIISSCLKEEIINPTDTNKDFTNNTHGITDQNYDMVFSQTEVKRIDIIISANNYKAMKEDLDDIFSSSGGPGGPGGPGGGFSDQDPIFVPATIVFNELEWKNIGIRYKGNSSLRDAYQQNIDKISFKLDFDEFEDTYPETIDQRFYGFKQLNLKNNSHDNSLLREKIASDIFRDAGIPSAMTSFYRVFVDFGEGPTYFGLYTMVEEVDNTVIKDQFINGSGNLYKPENDAATFTSGSFDETDLNKKTNLDLNDFTDVQEFYDALNDNTRTSELTAYKTRLENILDVDAFMHWLAVNTVIQNWDTYGNMTHNFYIYNDPAQDKFVWIPWDNNEALYEGKMRGALPIDLNDVGSNWPLIRYLMDIDEYKDIYDKYVEETINGVFEPSRMKTIYQTNYDLIEQYVIGIEGEQDGYSFLGSPSDFTSALTDLLNHVDERNSVAINYLK